MVMFNPYTDAEAIAAVEGEATLDLSGTLTVDVINEYTAAAGATIEGVLLKDGQVGPLLDNAKLILGTGSDAEIYYDGTDLIIDPDVVGSGVVKITGGASLDGAVVANESGADVNFRIEGDAAPTTARLSDPANLLFIDADEQRIGIGIGTPTRSIEVAGSTASGSLVNIPTFFLGNRSAATHSFSFHQTGANWTGSAYVVQSILGTDGLGTGGFIPGAVAGSYIGSFTNHPFFIGANNAATMEIDVDGGIYFFSLLAAAASTDVNINGSNELHSVTSSIEFKEQVRDLEIDSAIVQQLRPRSFRWREGTGSTGLEDLGLIAEEVGAIEPKLINYRRKVLNEGEIEVWRQAMGRWQAGEAEEPGPEPQPRYGPEQPYSIRHLAVTTMLVAEVQRLNSRVASLEARPGESKP